MRNDDPHGPIRGDRAYLVHSAEKQTFAIAHAPFRIGRDPSNHLQVLDAEVSRDHAEVRFEEGRHVVHTLGSGATLVNGVSVAGSAPLAEGDEIAVGEMRLRYTRHSATGAIVTEAGWADDIRVSQAPTDHTRKYEGSSSRDRPRSAMIIVVSATILLIVWALASLLMR